MDLRAALHSANERELALVQVMAEPSLSRAERGDLPRFVDACLDVGRRRAAEFLGADPAEALADLGYLVKRIPGPSPGSRAGFHLCAMTRSGDDAPGGTVELYVDEVAAKRRGLLAFDTSCPEEDDDLCRLHLAHELYHALEFSRGPMTPDVVPRVRMHTLFGLRERQPACSSEVAAHAFARRMAESPICPQLVDTLALIEEGSLSQEAFLLELEKAREMLSDSDACAACR